MRWPFANWLRGAPGRDDPTSGASEAATSAADPGPGPSPRIAARPAAWRDLPPLQRAVGATPLTAPSAVFARDLAGRRAPEPMLAPLGHDVTADGPAGLVSGIAVPLVQRLPSGSDRRPAPALPPPAARGRGRPTVQRGMTSVAAWPPSDTVNVAAGGPPLAGVAPEGSAEEAAEGPAAGPAASLPSLAPRMLPIARLATATPALSATRVAEASAPAPVHALARTVASGVSSGTSGDASGTPGMPSVTASVSGGADAESPADSPPVAQRSVPFDASGPASGSIPESGTAAPQALAGGTDPARPVVARRTLGESRRLGLGAPLTGRPPFAARETGQPDLPVARLGRSADAPGSRSAHLPVEPAVPAAAAASAPLPRLVVARRSTTAPEPVTEPATEPATVIPQASPELSGAADHGPAGVPIDVSVEATGESIAGVTANATRPLVGDAPIHVSRLARDEAPTGADGDGAGAGAAELGVTALRLAGASGPVPAATDRATVTESGATSAAATDPAVGPGPEPVSPASASSDPASAADPGAADPGVADPGAADPGVAAPSAAAGPGPEPVSAAATSSVPTAGPAGPAGYAGLTGFAAVQRSHALPVRGEPSRAAIASRAAAGSPPTRTTPTMAPLVAGHPMRASLPAAMATLGYAPTAEPAPVVARLSIPWSGTRDGGIDASPASLGGPAGSPAPPAAGAAAGRDERLAAGRDERPAAGLGERAANGLGERAVVARTALAAGRGPSPATLSALPLARSSLGTAVPDAAETGRPGGVASWSVGEGFTSVAPPSGPFVQRASSIDEMTGTPDGGVAGSAGSVAASPGPFVQRAVTIGEVTTTPGADGAGTGGAGTDYEELAEQVYGKIRARLTTELLLDRERAGMLVDG